MLKQGRRQSCFCIVACVLVILQVANAQGDIEAATGSANNTLGTSGVLGYGHREREPHYHAEHPHYREEPPHYREEPPHYREEPPHYKDKHMKDDYSGPDRDYHKHEGYSKPGVIRNCPSCRGRITVVWCWEDSRGRLQDIAYLSSEASGFSPTYLGCGGTTTPTREPTKRLFLLADENIVWIKTCDGKHDGDLEAVTFVTDKERRLTCGTHQFHAYDNDIEALSSLVNQSALAIEEEDSVEEAEEESVGADGIEPQSSQGKHRKYGRHTKAPKHKTRDDKPYAKPGYGKDAHDKPGYGKETYDKPGYGKDSYGEKDHEKPDYYKRDHHDKHGYKEHKGPYETEHEYHGHHEDEHRRCSAVDSRRACGGHKGPKDQTYPLAAFDVTCTPNKFVKAITDLCYNTNYTGPPPPPLPILVVTTSIALVLELSVCPNSPSDLQVFLSGQQTVSNQVREASKDSNGIPIIDGIAWQPYSAASCSSGNPQAVESNLVAQLMQASTENSTVTSCATFVANPPYTRTDVLNFLSNYTDACQIDRNDVDTCSGTPFVALPYTVSTACQAQALVSVDQQAATVNADAIESMPSIQAAPSQAQAAEASDQQVVTMAAAAPRATASDGAPNK